MVAADSSAVRHSYSTLRCVMMTPLGLPVVPDVYSSVTGSAGRIALTRRLTSAAASDSLASSLSDSNAAQLRCASSAGGGAGARRPRLRGPPRAGARTALPLRPRLSLAPATRDPHP